MKKNYILVLSLIMSAGINAQLLLHEPFDFTGVLNGQNGWARYSGTAGQLAVEAGTLTHPTLSNVSGNKAFSTPAATEDVAKAISVSQTGVVYYSALIQFKSATLLNSTGDYGLHFVTAVPPPTSGYIGRLFYKLNAAGTAVNFGVLNTSGGSPAPSYAPIDIPIGATTLVVVKLDTATKTASVFVNAVPGSTEATADASSNLGTLDTPNVMGIAIRQGGSASVGGTGEVYIDELRIGKTWADVTPVNMSIAEIKKNDYYLKNTIVNDVLHFNKAEKATVSIYTMSGQLVKNFQLQEDHYDVSDLQKANYIIKLHTQGGVITSKFIKK